MDVYDKYGNRIGTASRGSPQGQALLYGCLFLGGIGYVWASITSMIAHVLAMIAAIRKGHIKSMLVAHLGMTLFVASFGIFLYAIFSGNKNFMTYLYVFAVVFLIGCGFLFFTRNTPYFIIYFWYYVRFWPPGVPAWLTIGTLHEFTVHDLRSLSVDEAVGIYAR